MTARPSITHTPGPWKIHDAPNQHMGAFEGWHVTHPTARGQDSIAFVFDPGDARLIAEAPALLEALSELVAEWSQGGCMEDRNDTEAVRMAREIVARIGGQS